MPSGYAKPSTATEKQIWYVIRPADGSTTPGNGLVENIMKDTMQVDKIGIHHLKYTSLQFMSCNLWLFYHMSANNMCSDYTVKAPLQTTTDELNFISDGIEN